MNDCLRIAYSLLAGTAVTEHDGVSFAESVEYVETPEEQFA
ncbi:MAG: hypothetical protein OXF07_04245 [Rhodobacter sp.]|nr:hypothetical protein [Rhodobacter sp.]MCY4168226.1 hypothetical protein [Rhodobacter sp.]MCY4241230.1 hypothetical protein [Rhodobacter sp.]